MSSRSLCALKIFKLFNKLPLNKFKKLQTNMVFLELCHLPIPTHSPHLTKATNWEMISICFLWDVPDSFPHATVQGSWTWPHMIIPMTSSVTVIDGRKTSAILSTQIACYLGIPATVAVASSGFEVSLQIIGALLFCCAIQEPTICHFEYATLSTRLLTN